jgi:hypothetical protein
MASGLLRPLVLDAETSAALNPLLTVDVWSKYGHIWLPESPVEVVRGSATCEDRGVNGMDPLLGGNQSAKTCASITGTINQVNEALARVEYELSPAHPHLNSFSMLHAMYGKVDEFVRVRINDGLGKQTLSCFVLLLQLHITTP